MKRLALLALFLSGTAYGQAWDTNVIRFTLPTTCTTGEPISACPITGVRIERSATTNGTYTTVGTAAANATSYTHTGAAAGQNCYRAIVLSNGGNSDPSNVLCKTNTRPVGPPNPAVLTIIEANVFDLKRVNGENYLSRHVGTAVVGSPAYRRYTVANGTGWCQVLRSKVTHHKPSSGVLVARCA